MDRKELLDRADSLARTDRDRARRRALILGASKIRKLVDEAARIHRAAIDEEQALAALVMEGTDAISTADPLHPAADDSTHGIPALAP